MVDRVKQMVDIQTKALELFIKKNADYGDAFAKHGLIGVLIRIQDKIQRALSITTNNISFIEDEGISDTMIDLHNYSAMALMLMEEGKSEKYSYIPKSDNNSHFIEFYDEGDDGYDGYDGYEESENINELRLPFTPIYEHLNAYMSNNIREINKEYGDYPDYDDNVI
jgi:hypothetical protein